MSAEQLFYEGTRLLGCGSIEEAESAFRSALAMDPELAEGHANLGLLLDKAGRSHEAETSYRRAIELAPEQTQTYINLGAMLGAQRRFAEAEDAYRAALAIEPDSPMAWSNLGVLLACAKRETEAEACYRVALEVAPGYQSACFNLAYLLLRQGRFEEGWQRLESRYGIEQLEKQIGIPRWQGESLVGKSILIGLEGGNGDMIQFCRYAAQLKERGAVRVSVLCHPALKALFSTMTGIDDAIAIGDPDPNIAWDYWAPTFSLLFLFGTRLGTIPGHLPYLHADSKRIEHWSALMGETGNALKVGLVWKGNPAFENDSERSLRSLAELAALGRVDGVRYFSLQKGAGEDEAKLSAPFPIVDLGSSVSDFADTAAILMNLDLLISVDTAVAHLAGALGKTCWVMLPDYKTDWRWLTMRNDSPWYPKVMRLFRQKESGNWGELISEIKLALEERCREKVGCAGNAAMDS